jgi:uncharacterized protein (TIGR02391 family)
MNLIDLFPTAELLVALEPEELGLRLLPLLAEWNAPNLWYQTSQLGLDAFIESTFANPQPTGPYPQERRAEVELAIREAWAWLEGAALLIKDPRFIEPNRVRQLSRRAHQLASDPNPRRALSARRIPKDSLHPSIREDVWALYHRGKYDTAVFESMKAVEVAVRGAVAGQPCEPLLGVKLMRGAFAPDGGPLTDASADGGERVARMELFAGAIGSYKNPHSHRNVALDDPDEAADIIMLANHLLRIVDACATGSPKP